MTTAEILSAHQRNRAVRGLNLVCSCGWVGPRLNQQAALIAHQAEQLDNRNEEP